MMKCLLLAGALLSAGSLYAASAICPTTSSNSTGADATGCGVLITFGASGAPTISITGTGPYDGSEDTTVGVINNSKSVVSTLSLTSASGTDAFGWDGDGIEQGFTSVNGVTIGTGGATGYEGPTSTFNQAGINSAGDGTLIVNFAPGIAVGGSSYFSLEGTPSIGGGITVGGSAPEPGTFGALAAGLLGLAGLVRYRTAKK